MWNIKPKETEELYEGKWKQIKIWTKDKVVELLDSAFTPTVWGLGHHKQESQHVYCKGQVPKMSYGTHNSLLKVLADYLYSCCGFKTTVT